VCRHCQQAAEVQCFTCELQFCAACSGRLHNKGLRAQHKVGTLQEMSPEQAQVTARKAQTTVAKKLAVPTPPQFTWQEDRAWDELVSKCKREIDTENETVVKTALAEPKRLDTLHLCTFTQTRKNFTRQPYFKCLTCGPDGTYSTCVPCGSASNGCHAGHKLQLCPEGDIFCGCGADETQKLCKIFTSYSEQEIKVKAEIIPSVEKRLVQTDQFTDLEMATHVSSNELHAMVTCDGCLAPVQGVRYRCLICPEFELCAKCYARRLTLHNDNGYWCGHVFLMLLRPIPQSKYHLLPHPEYMKSPYQVLHERTVVHELLAQFRANPGFLETNVLHVNICCRGCGNDVTGARYLCLCCTSADANFRTFDLCSSCHRRWNEAVLQKRPTPVLMPGTPFRHLSTHIFAHLTFPAPVDKATIKFPVVTEELYDLSVLEMRAKRELELAKDPIHRRLMAMPFAPTNHLLINDQPKIQTTSSNGEQDFDGGYSQAYAMSPLSSASSTRTYSSYSSGYSAYSGSKEVLLPLDGSVEQRDQGDEYGQYGMLSEDVMRSLPSTSSGEAAAVLDERVTTSTTALQTHSSYSAMNDSYGSLHELIRTRDGIEVLAAAAVSHSVLDGSSSTSTKSLSTLAASRNWNDEYQRLVEEIQVLEANSRTGTVEEQKAELHRKYKLRIALYQLQSDFATFASGIARIIIEELHLPPTMKSIQPAVGVGGIAGGEKYIVQGCFFKFASDLKHLYGSDEFAMKSAAWELKGINAYKNLSIPMLCSPLVRLIDYLGYRIIVSSLLPLPNSSTGIQSLVYGSGDQCQTVHSDDPECNRLIAIAGERLNLKSHVVGSGSQSKSLYGPGDIEVHKGVDGRFYVIDAARVSPPEAPRMLIPSILLPAEPGTDQVQKESNDVATSSGGHSGLRILELNRASALNEAQSMLLQSFKYKLKEFGNPAGIENSFANVAPLKCAAMQIGKYERSHTVFE
jgi:hypothetical protein